MDLKELFKSFCVIRDAALASEPSALSGASRDSPSTEFTLIIDWLASARIVASLANDCVSVFLLNAVDKSPVSAASDVASALPSESVRLLPTIFDRSRFPEEMFSDKAATVFNTA